MKGRRGGGGTNRYLVPGLSFEGGLPSLGPRENAKKRLSILSINTWVIGSPSPFKRGTKTFLTLIKTEYWDRAGGGGNISYDW